MRRSPSTKLFYVRPARLILGWVTDREQVNHLADVGMYNQPRGDGKMSISFRDE